MKSEKPIIKVRVEATITINSDEAAILEHLTSYNLADTFAAKFSHRFNAEEIKSVLTSLRGVLHRIISTDEKCRQYINEGFAADGK